jgi:putative glutamine amidotransferase
MQPIIGITGRPQDVQAVELTIQIYAVAHTYTDSIRSAGGLPIVVIPIEDDEIDDVLDRLDGVLFTGGGDISPESYGAVAEETIRGVKKGRDAFELELARRAYARRIPVMAICRGLQVVNVALGGTLVQDLPTHADVHDHDIVGEGVYEAHLDLVVDEGCRLAGIIGAGPQNINSIHHQAVDTLGKGLSVVARATDGTVEAIEHEDSSWPLIAVQWHPEFLAVADHGPSNELFAAFVEAAAKYRADA